MIIKDKLIIEHSDLTYLDRVRNSIMKNFKDVWVYLHTDHNAKIFGIEVTTSFGNSVPKEKYESIKTHIASVQ